METPSELSTIASPEQQRRAEWQAAFERWQASGLSKAAFCRREALNVTQFYYWCGVFDGRQSAPVNSRTGTEANGAAFIPVRLAHESAATLSIQLADVTLNCTAPVSAEQLQSWLMAIRRSV
jgi:hypothetical protein